MKTSRECFSFHSKDQLMISSDTPLLKAFNKRQKGSRQGLEEDLSCLETWRNTTGQMENTSSWCLESYSSLELDDTLPCVLEQKSMVLEDFRSHEFRKSVVLPVQALPKNKVEIQCSKTELYDFHSQIVTALSFLEDGLNDNFALVLGNLCFEINVRNSGTKIPNCQDIRNSFQIEEETIVSAMQEAFRNLECERTNSIIIQDIPEQKLVRTKNNVQDKIEWEMLELAMLKEEYKNKVQEADKTYQVNQNMKNNLKLNLIDLQKQRGKAERTETNLKKKMNDFVEQKRAFQVKVEQVKEKFSKFSSKFISLTSLVPEFEEHTGIIKKNILSDDEIDGIHKEIAALYAVLASSQSESETKNVAMKINRLKTRLVCARSSKVLQNSTYTREIHSLDREKTQEEEIALDDHEIIKEVEFIKAKLNQEREKVRERHNDMYAIWTRSFENNNILDVVRSHTSKMYRLEDELTKTQDDLQKEQIRLACKKKALRKNYNDFKCQRKCFEEGMKEVMMESKMILECI